MTNLTQDLLQLTNAANYRAIDESGDFDLVVDDVRDDVIELLYAPQGCYSDAELHREVLRLLSKLRVRATRPDDMTRGPIPAELQPADVTAIVDTREQLPLDLSPLRVERGTLATGDYSVRRSRTRSRH